MEEFSKIRSINDIKNFIEKSISVFIEKENNPKIKSILEHSLKDGKRIRPIISFLVFKNLSFERDIDIEKLGQILIVPEILHNISLIIDDLPFMDNDKFRREKESTHYKYGVIPSYISILKIINNSLYNFLDDIDPDRTLNFNKGGKIENINFNNFFNDYISTNLNDLLDGQYYDLHNLNLDYELEIICKINSKKTAPLFTLSFMTGLIAISFFNPYYIIDDFLMKQIKNLGELFGFIFQLNDDIIDRVEDKKNNKKLNICLHLGYDNSIDLFKEKCILFEQELKKIKLWNTYFKEILELLKKRININC